MTTLGRSGHPGIGRAALATFVVLAITTACGGASAPGPSQPAPVAGAPSGTAASPAPAVWYGSVQSIVQARCLGCHVPGGIAPFSLATYEDALPHHAQMSSVVRSGFMPPWPPSDNCEPLLNPRRLGSADVQTIAAWSDAGAPPGDPALSTPAPPPAGGLAWVDAELAPAEPYLPNASTNDDYRCFRLDPQLAVRRDLIGVDVQPGQRRFVHHVLLFDVGAEEAAAADAAEPGGGWTCFGGPAVATRGTIGGWVPGAGATAFPAGTGIPLLPGRAIVMQVHYHLGGETAEPDRTIARLQFAREPVARPATAIPVADLDFSIPPGSRGYNRKVTFTVPVTFTLWGVAPHMHTLGRSIRVEKDGACLVDIPSWDFHWQQFYQFARPQGLTVPAGSRLTLSCTWDNPGDRAVAWGENTTDEMCLSYLYATP